MSQTVTFDEHTIPAHELEAFRQNLPELLKELNAGDVGMASEAYVEAVPQWWGLVFVLSNQAAQDLSTGAAGVGAVSAAITAALSGVPGMNVLAGIVTAIIGLYAAVIQGMNRGKGVYITALWPSILFPTHWIPTPRL